MNKFSFFIYLFIIAGPKMFRKRHEVVVFLF